MAARAHTAGEGAQAPSEIQGHMKRFRCPRLPPPAAVNYDLLSKEQAADLRIRKPAGATGLKDLRSQTQRKAEDNRLLLSHAKLVRASQLMVSMILQLSHLQLLEAISMPTTTTFRDVEVLPTKRVLKSCGI